MKNKISIHNYEAYLLDYMEGNLSKEDLFELQMFAAQHPHLNIDLNDLELVELSVDEVGFENKESLKKTGISDEKFVAYIENELNAEEKQNIDLLCAKDAKLAKDLRLFQHTIIKAETSVVFENKTQLKKQETKVLLLFSREVLAAAASLILIMGLWFMFRNFIPGTGTLNSQKINGSGKVNTIALHKAGTISAFTSEKKTDTVSKDNNAGLLAKNNKQKENKTVKEAPVLVANNTPTENATNSNKDLNKNNSIKKEENETAKYASNTNPKSAENKTTASKPYVIVEKAYDEDEKQLASNEKNGIWKKAMKAFNGLNKLGFKRVKGEEKAINNNDQTLLSLGNFSIENKKYNAQ